MSAWSAPQSATWRAVVPADHEVGALALADLVGDDRLDELGVLVVVDVEAAAVGELDPHVVDRVDHLGDGELLLALDVDDDQRRAVVVRLEPALPDLAERDRDQPVGDVPGLGDALLERDVEDRLDHLAPVPPTSPTVSRSPARVDRRMIAHASCPCERSDGVPERSRRLRSCAGIYRRPAAGRRRLSGRPAALGLVDSWVPAVSPASASAFADHTIWSTAWSASSPPTSVSQTSDSIPLTARTATARRRTPSSPSCCFHGRAPRESQPMARPCRRGRPLLHPVGQ